MLHLKFKNKVPVVVLRSNDICFLGILRSCYAAEIPVIPVVFTWSGASEWFSEHSRTFYQPTEITNPFEDPKAAIEQLVEVGKKLFQQWGQKLFLIPSSDTNLMFMLDYFDKLSPYFMFMGSSDHDQKRIDLVQKELTADVLHRNNIPTPKTIKINSKIDIDDAAREIAYPCIVKPSQKDYGQSFYRRHNGLKAVECTNKPDLISVLKDEIKFSYHLIVQEKVIFDSPYEEIPFYIFADKNGEIKIASSAVKEKIQPYPYGTATVLRINYISELLPIAQKIVDAFKWRGFLMIEFIKDKKDGQWKVIELNGRPWLLIDFFRRSNLPYIQYLYDDFYKNVELNFISPQGLPENKQPVHFLLKDISKDIWKNAETEENKLANLSSFIKSYAGFKSSFYFYSEDEGPGLAELDSISKNFSVSLDKLVQLLKDSAVL